MEGNDKDRETRGEQGRGRGGTVERTGEEEEKVGEEIEE